MRVVDIAALAHHVNSMYCQAIGDVVPAPWQHCSAEQQQSMMKGVMMHLANPGVTAEQSHESWLAHKAAEGWTWGKTKDEEAKIHPNMLPYEALPQAQKVKDSIFKAVVLGLAPYLLKMPSVRPEPVDGPVFLQHQTQFVQARISDLRLGDRFLLPAQAGEIPKGYIAVSNPFVNFEIDPPMWSIHSEEMPVQILDEHGQPASGDIKAPTEAASTVDPVAAEESVTAGQQMEQLNNQINEALAAPTEEAPEDPVEASAEPEDARPSTTEPQ